jgi:hypothetical protein
MEPKVANIDGFHCNITTAVFLLPVWQTDKSELRVGWGGGISPVCCVAVSSKKETTLVH